MAATDARSDQGEESRRKRRDQFVICAACGREFSVQSGAQGAAVQCPACDAQVVVGSAVKVSARRKRRRPRFSWLTVLAVLLVLAFFLSWFHGPITDWHPFERGGQR